MFRTIYSQYFCLSKHPLFHSTHIVTVQCADVLATSQEKRIAPPKVPIVFLDQNSPDVDVKLERTYYTHGRLNKQCAEHDRPFNLA